MHRNPLKELVQNGTTSQQLSEPLSSKVSWKPTDAMEAVTILGRGRNKPQLEGGDVGYGGTKDRAHAAETTTPTVVPKTPLKPTKPGQYPISRTPTKIALFRISALTFSVAL